jgi:hypothetical protein
MIQLGKVSNISFGGVNLGDGCVVGFTEVVDARTREFRVTVSDDQLDVPDALKRMVSEATGDS